jgi:hypothetical protein
MVSNSGGMCINNILSMEVGRMKFKDLCTKRTFEVNGEIKTKWYKVGTLRTAQDGKQFITLFLLPDVTIYVFEERGEECGR